MKVNSIQCQAVTLFLSLVAMALYLYTSSAWYDETHVAIAKVAGYEEKWFNAAGPAVAKTKMGDKDRHHHLANRPNGTMIKP